MKFTKHHNPNRRRKARRDTATAWSGAGSRENYINSLIYLQAEKLKKEDKRP